MPVSFACPRPACRRPLLVPEDRRGTAIRCPQCGQVFTTPPLPGPAATLTVPPEPAATLTVPPDPAASFSIDPFPITSAETVEQTPPTSVTARPAARSGYIGRFELRQRLGEGAFGVVYRAYDAQLDREVALKIAKGEMLDTLQRVERFLREAKAAAQLRHPNIVPLFEAGRDGEQYYIASAYIDGRTLAAAIETDRPDFRQASHIVRRLAEALAYAHSLGIVHRDVKPANVMIDSKGEPLVLDFGLAARVDDEKLTQEGTALGTPAYMAPEQAAGNAEAASDQYSLGCVLYELLTGQTPFSGPPAIQLLLHQEKDPPAPRRISAKVPRDLETICLKCLEKQPGKRYADCQALADDLRRWGEGEPITARRLNFAERLARLVRRQPALVATCALSIVALVLIGFGASVTWLWKEAVAQRGQAEGAQKQAEGAQRVAEQEREKAREAETNERAAKLQAARLQYLRQVDLAHREWQTGNIVRARELLEECDPGPGERPWEWCYVYRLCHAELRDLPGQPSRVHCVALSADGKRVVSGTEDGAVKVWDPTRGELLHTLKGNNGAIQSVAISADGSRIVSGCRGIDEFLRLWDGANGKLLRTLKGPVDTVEGLAISPDGKRIVSGSVEKQGNGKYIGSIKLWDADTGQVLATFHGHDGFVWSVALSTDGKRIVSASQDTTLKIWDVATQKELRSIPAHTAGARAVALSPDGRFIVSAGWEGAIKIWEPESGQMLRQLPTSGRAVYSVAFSANGQRLVSGGEDKAVRVWDVGSWLEIGLLKGHAACVTSVAISPNGDRIVSGGGEQNPAYGEIKLWDPDRGQQALTILGQYQSVAIDADGRRVVTVGGWDRLVHIWDAGTGKEIRALKGHAETASSVAVSPDGKRIVSGGPDKTVCIWDSDNGEVLRTITGAGAVERVAMSEDGSRVAACTGISAKVWLSSTGKEVLSLPNSTARIAGMALSADGKRLAVGGFERTIKVWDVDSGKLVVALEGHTNQVQSLAFSADGRRLVSASIDRTVRLWNLSSGKEIRTLQGHTQPVLCVTISARGDRIVSSGGGGATNTPGELKVWDTVTGQETLSLGGHNAAVDCVAFSANGRRIVGSSCNDIRVKIWDGSAPDNLPAKAAKPTR